MELLGTRGPSRRFRSVRRSPGGAFFLVKKRIPAETMVCRIPYHTIPYYTIRYDTILYYTLLYYTILYYTILYYTILYYTILYYTILYYTIPYHNMPDQPCSRLSNPKGSKCIYVIPICCFFLYVRRTRFGLFGAAGTARVFYCHGSRIFSSVWKQFELFFFLDMGPRGPQRPALQVGG